MRASCTLLLLTFLVLTSSGQIAWAQSTRLAGQPYYARQPQAQFSPPESQYQQLAAPPIVSPPIVSPQIGDPEQYFQQPLINNSCCQPCQDQAGCDVQGGFFAGFAAVFAKPHFKEAFEASQINTATGMQTLFPFQYDYEFTPRVFFGFKTDSGAGVRVSYWNFDADGTPFQGVADGTNIFAAHAVNIIFPANIFAAAPGQTLDATSSLNTQILDLYLTVDGTMGSISATGGFGLRYGKLTQSLNSMVSFPPGPPSAILQWEREFEGVGPSVYLDAKKRLGNTRLSGVVSGGGALLFGSKQLNRTVIGDQSPQPAAPFLNLQDADEVVGIGEISLGAEWEARMRGGRSFRVRGTYEGQLWAEAGAPTLGFLGFEGFGIQVELAR